MEPTSRAPKAVGTATAAARSVVGSQVLIAPAQAPATQRTVHAVTEIEKSPGSTIEPEAARPRCTVPGSGGDAATPTCHGTGTKRIIDDVRSGSLMEVSARYWLLTTVSTSAACAPPAGAPTTSTPAASNVVAPVAIAPARRPRRGARRRPRLPSLGQNAQVMSAATPTVRQPSTKGFENHTTTCAQPGTQVQTTRTVFTT